MPFWLLALPVKGGGVSAPAAARNRTWELLQEKTSYGVQLSSNYRLDVPDLRVGTLDTLLALSDDLVKVSTAVEQVVTKIRRTVVDMAGPGAVPTLKVENLPVDAYLTRFKWDEPKFPLRRPLRETVDKIAEVMSHIEDDLKVRFAAAHGAGAGAAAAAHASAGAVEAAAAPAYRGGARGRAARPLVRCAHLQPARRHALTRPGAPHTPPTSQVKVGEFNTVKSQLSAALRKAGGSLAVRDISTVVKPEQVCAAALRRLCRALPAGGRGQQPGGMHAWRAAK
jgi:hypothetical protein